jgi:hypothetical protein
MYYIETFITLRRNEQENKTNGMTVTFKESVTFPEDSKPGLAPDIRLKNKYWEEREDTWKKEKG